MTKASHPTLVSSVFLGTAGWGRKVSKTEAHRILETFYGYGFCWIDTATNYPIDRNPENYGKTIEWLSDFHSDFSELRVFVKTGSATNLGDHTQLINASYFALVFDILVSQLRGCLGGLGIHWDNGTAVSDRMAVIDFFSNINNNGFAIGLSGISESEIYTVGSIAMGLPWIFQINFSPVRLEHSILELDQIRSDFPKAKVYGYNLLGGTTAKGLLEDGGRFANLNRLINGPTEENRGKILEQIISRCISFNIDGLVIGPTSAVQCLDWCTNLNRFHLD